MSTPEFITITGSFEVRPNLVSPGGWLDYMGKEFNEPYFKKLDVLLECIDRARILLQDYDSDHVAETIEVVELLISLYFDEDNTRLEVSDWERYGVTQNVFRRGEISEPLALTATLNKTTPRLLAINRAAPLQKHTPETSTSRKHDWYGVDPVGSDAHSLYLAALALRDSFSATRLFVEAEACTSVSFDISPEQYSDPSDLIDECQTEADSINDEMLGICTMAAHKSARAMEAITLAENLLTQSILRRYTEKKQEDAVKSAKQQALSEAASKAATARHAGNRELRDLAIKLFQEGAFQSTRQAAKQIFPQVQKHGLEIGCRLSADRGEKTVYDWLLQST